MLAQATRRRGLHPEQTATHEVGLGALSLRIQMSRCYMHRGHGGAVLAQISKGTTSLFPANCSVSDISADVN